MDVPVWDVSRTIYNSKATLGILTRKFNKHYDCIAYTLEDAYRYGYKVDDHTCIPHSIYKVEFRREGGMYTRDRKRERRSYPEGMLWLKYKYDNDKQEFIDNWEFEYVYIHIGNTIGDTQGCILVGNQQNMDVNTVVDSRSAFKKVYTLMSHDIKEYGHVLLHINNCNVLFNRKAGT